MERSLSCRDRGGAMPRLDFRRLYPYGRHTRYRLASRSAMGPSPSLGFFPRLHLHRAAEGLYTDLHLSRLQDFPSWRYNPPPCPRHIANSYTDEHYPANERPGHIQSRPVIPEIYIDFICSLKSLRLWCILKSPDLLHRTVYRCENACCLQ
jgi:hypothetical protein